MEIKLQRRYSRVIILSFWSEKHSSRNPGCASYNNTYILFSSHKQLSPASWAPWSGTWKVLTAATSSLHSASCFPFSLQLLAPLKSQKLHDWLSQQLLFSQRHLWFFPFLLPTASLPHLGWRQTSSKKTSRPNSNLQIQEVATTTDRVPTEPLHHRRELCHRTKTNFFLLISSNFGGPTTKWPWVLGLWRPHPNRAAGFAPWEVTRATFPLYLPHGAPSRQGLSGSGHGSSRRSWN